MDGDFFVKAGQLLRAGPWNAAGRAIRALRILSGFGVRLRETSNGTIINFDGGAQTFDHPFRVTLDGPTLATIRPGRVNTIPAKIKGILLEGDDENEPPQLEFEEPKFDKDGRGWIAVEVTCSKTDWSIVAVEVVQVSDLDTDDGLAPKDSAASGSPAGGVPNLPGRRARWPLAMLRKRLDGVVMFQSTMHDLQHRRKAATADATADVGRHFFYPTG
jgi:hypothetical protein